MPHPFDPGTDVPASAKGEMNMRTGVMCSNYHDVWMELREDLILTRCIDRGTKGDF